MGDSWRLIPEDCGCVVPTGCLGRKTFDFGIEKTYQIAFGIPGATFFAFRNSGRFLPDSISLCFIVFLESGRNLPDCILHSRCNFFCIFESGRILPHFSVSGRNLPDFLGSVAYSSILSTYFPTATLPRAGGAVFGSSPAFGA